MSNTTKQKGRGIWRKDKRDRGLYLRGKTWYIRFRDGMGRLRAESVGPSEKFARKALEKRRTEVREGRYFPPAERLKPVAFERLLDDALTHSKEHNTQSTYKTNFFNARKLRSWFNGREAATITAEEIDAHLTQLAADGLKPSTLNQHKALLSVAYSIGIRSNKVKENPAAKVQKRRENNMRSRFLTEEEERRLRAAIRKSCPKREPEFDLALQTGMRRGELYGMKWEDVDFALRQATIPRAKHGERRFIYLSTVAVEALKKLAGQRSRIGYVCRRDHEHSERRWFEPCAAAAGVRDFRFHDLRHTFASRLTMAGVDPFTLQELMGHKTLSMTRRYSHLAPRHLHEAVEKLATIGSVQEVLQTENDVPSPSEKIVYVQ